MFHLQNLINSDRTLNAKYMNIDTKKSSRPIIATTTIDLAARLKEKAGDDKDHLDVVKQFERRIITVKITDDKTVARFGILTHKGNLPARYQCLLFW